MTLQLSKKGIIILIFTIVLILALVFGSYFLYLQPKKESISTSETQLKSEEQVLATINSKQAETSPVTVESIGELLKKVPVKPQLEQMILDLEKAEVLSNSMITNMTFSEADVTGQAQQPAPAQPQTNEQANKSTQTETNQTTNSQTNPQANNQQQSTNSTNQQAATNTGQAEIKTETVTPLPLPEGIKKLTVTLAVQSPSYAELIKFIDALEGLNRLVAVDSVSFTGGSEITNLEQKLEEMSYTLTFSAFYMPKLEDLQKLLPGLDTPAPGDKTYPFSSFPELPEEDQN